MLAQDFPSSSIDILSGSTPSFFQESTGLISLVALGKLDVVWFQFLLRIVIALFQVPIFLVSWLGSKCDSHIPILV